MTGDACRYVLCAGRGLGHAHTTGTAAPVPDACAHLTVAGLILWGLPLSALGFRDPAATVIPPGDVLRNIQTT